MKYAILVSLIIFCRMATAQDIKPDKNLVWNRYTTKNFVILSIDNLQGKWISDNIEKMKTQCVTAWGFDDIKLDKECRIFVVPNKDLMQKFFEIESSKIEFRHDLNAMWILMNDHPSKILPLYVTQAVFNSIENTNKMKFPLWFNRGASYLNQPVPVTKQRVLGLSDVAANNHMMFTAEQIFTMSASDYLNHTNENRAIFDKQAAIICLLLRKEFGQIKLQYFLRLSQKNDVKVTFEKVYRFSNMTAFNKNYVRYVKDLTYDILNNKTPDSYIRITSK